MSDDNDNTQQPDSPVQLRQHDASAFLNEAKKQILEESSGKVHSTIVVVHTDAGELRIFASPQDPGHTISLLSGAIDVWARSTLAQQRGESDDGGEIPPAA